MSIDNSYTQPIRNPDYLRSRGVHRPIMPQIIQGIYQGKKYPGNVLFQLYCQQVRKAFANVKQPSGKREKFARLFGVLESRSSVFDGYPKSHGKLVNALINIAARQDRWVRDPELWYPPDSMDDPRQQLGSFLTHLTSAYQVPRFFYSIFEKRDWVTRQEYQWYMDLSAGKNIRNSANLPVQLSKKAAHYMMQSPNDLSVWQAFVWGELRAVVNDEQLIDCLLKTNFVRSMTHSIEHWYSNTRFPEHGWLIKLALLFDRTRGLNLDDVGPIVDYVEQHQAISLKGRTVSSLQRDVEEWHNQLYTNRYRKELLEKAIQWQPLKNIQGRFFFVPIQSEQCFWQIEELCSGNQLIQEGRRMNHCVATYITACESGSSSIWSLRCSTPSGELIRGATIEIREQRGEWKIIQARAVQNQRPAPELIDKIVEWAEANGIDASILR